MTDNSAGVGLAGRCGFALLAIAVLVLPIMLMVGYLDIAKFTVITTVWLLVSALLIIGSEVTEITLWKASIKRNARSAEKDAQAAREAREAAEVVRAELHEIARLVVECSFMSVSTSTMALGDYPMTRRFTANLERITDIVEPDPVKAKMWQEEVREVLRSSMDPNGSRQ